MTRTDLFKQRMGNIELSSSVLLILFFANQVFFLLLDGSIICNLHSILNLGRGHQHHWPFPNVAVSPCTAFQRRPKRWKNKTLTLFLFYAQTLSLSLSLSLSPPLSPPLSISSSLNSFSPLHLWSMPLLTWSKHEERLQFLLRNQFFFVFVGARKTSASRLE